jgi:hypothetical protein
LQQRQAAQGGNAGAQRFEFGGPSCSAVALVGLTVIRASERVSFFGRQQQGDATAVGHVAFGVQRFRVLAVVGHEQGDLLVDDHLTERIEQAGAEAGVVGADHLARRHCLVAMPQ